MIENNVINLSPKHMTAMKLLHYFITEKNYTPIILQGAEDEIWLENLEEDYKIVRIVLRYIHNEEQYKFDIFKTNRIIKKIKAKTFSWKMKTLSIFLDLGSSVELEKLETKNLTPIQVTEEKDIKKDKVVRTYYPDLPKRLKQESARDEIEMFVRVTNEINEHNRNDQKKMEDVFSPKLPVITYTLIFINVLCYLLPLLIGREGEFFNSFAVYGPFIKMGQYYRLITGAFLHAGLVHLLFNMYALWIIGIQLESFIGKWRYLLVYFFSAITASLLAIVIHSDVASVGASGAIFGLLGALLYFGYHYRVYLGNVMKSQIIPVIVVNLILGFLMPGVDNAAHIGGLIGGCLIMIGAGVKYKSSTFERVNGIITSLLYLSFLLYMAFVFVK